MNMIFEEIYSKFKMLSKSRQPHYFFGVDARQMTPIGVFVKHGVSDN